MPATGDELDAGVDVSVPSDVRDEAPDLTPGCDRTGFSRVAGQPCDNGQPCDTASTCIQEENGSAVCRQVCSIGACERLCNFGSECFEVVDGAGQVIPVDLDRDGFNEVLGVCLTPPPPVEVPAWGECGGSLFCEPGSGCAGTGGGRPPVCLPICRDACPLESGYLPECVPAGSVSVCVIWCDPVDGAVACPYGMRCNPLPGGGAICGR